MACEELADLSGPAHRLLHEPEAEEPAEHQPSQNTESRDRRRNVAGSVRDIGDHRIGCVHGSRNEQSQRGKTEHQRLTRELREEIFHCTPPFERDPAQRSRTRPST